MSADHPSASDHPLRPLLAPRSIALVGASARAGSFGAAIVEQVRDGGFRGRVHAVNPNHDRVAGLACQPSLAALPEAVDLAVLAVGNHRLEEQLDAAIAAGAGAAAIFASGYLEGDRYPPLLERLRAKARAARLPICGGNCMGFHNHESGAWICGYPVAQGSRRSSRPGPITFITHSGTAFGSMMDCGGSLSFNLVVSAGQEIATTAADYMDYALTLASTRVIALFLETVRDPAGFVAALAKAAARDVPVVALKVGRTAEAARLARSHSGAIAGNDAAFDAIRDRFGVIRVDTLDELAASAALLALPKRAVAGGLAAITDSGGERAMLVDLAADAAVPFARIDATTRERLAARLEHGLEPVNPCDAWGTRESFKDVFGACFEALINDPDSALGVFFADIRTGRFISETYVDLCVDIAARAAKPVALATNISIARHAELAQRLSDGGVPVLAGTAEALRAVSAALAYRDFRARAPMTPPAPPDPATVAAWRRRLARGDTLGEVEGLALLADFGLATAPAILVESRGQALAAAKRLGYPLVAKTATAGIDHKADVGGVKLGIDDDDALAAAYDDLARRLGARVTVAAMAEPGVELALGVDIDPQFGPLVMVGAGGGLIELLRDARFALAPFDAATAGRLIDGLRLRPLLDGWRGEAAADRDALADAVARFSVLAAELGDVINEIDANPLIAGPHGCVAVDALVIGRQTKT